MAVASAGPYASLHLAPDRYHASTPPLSVYRPDALPVAHIFKRYHNDKHFSAELYLQDGG